MGSCCSTAKSKEAATAPPTATKTATKTAGKTAETTADHEKPTNAVHIRPVAFDVVVPDNAASAAAAAAASGQKLNERDYNMSCTMFDASMHTVRDMSLAIDRSAAADPLGATMNNMSFTNSFAAVDKTAVQDFMKNVARLAQQGSGKQSLLEGSMLGPSAAGDANRSMLGGGTSSSAITPEDLSYIAAGPTLMDRVARLQEVEGVLRQTIEGTWRVDSMLLQLACCQVVPTLRQRRRPWSAAAAGAAAKGGSQGTAQSGSGIRSASAGGQRKPVLVIHAPGVQIDPSMNLAASGRSSSPTHASPSRTRPSRGDYSPPSVTETPPTEQPLEKSISRSRLEPPPGAKVEQYELLALTGRDVDVHKCAGAVVENDSWDFLANEKGAPTINEGKCIFRFMCSSLAEVDDETKATVDALVNLSSFKDEVAENNTPKVNVHDPEDAAKYIAIIVKSMYLLPGVNVKDITKEMIVSTDYQKACQPSENKVQDCEVDDTFRLTMTIVRFIFSLTIQFKVCEITDPAVLESLSVCDGMVPAKVIMLERTKRNISKTDATAKVRSMLLYYPVNDGVLVDNFTIVLNTSLPKVVSKIMNTFGSQGASQSVQTTKLTREYLINRFGDSRSK